MFSHTRFTEPDMNENQMQHGVDCSSRDLSGWVATEKFDGCRAYWDGKQMWSRGGIEIIPPSDWREHLPQIALDGEIYFGSEGRSKCATAVRYGRFLPGMQFIVFDAPAADGDYISRLKTARTAVSQNDFVNVARPHVIKNNTDALTMLQGIVAKGGEGIMCRVPSLIYRPGRTAQMVKVKFSFQLEA